MPYRIKKKQLQNILKDAISTSKDDGKEICGLIINTGYFLELIQTKNKIKRGGSFAFYVNEINKIKKAALVLNYEIVGTFHSHPYYFAKPGKSDLVNAENDDLMLIIDCIDKEIMLWKIKNGKTNKVKYELL